MTFKYKNLVYRVISESNKTAAVKGITEDADEFDIPEKVNGYTVTEIDDYAFKQSDVKTINIQNTSNSMQIIGCGAFLKCIYLEEINLPNSITTMGEYAFAFCRNLKNIKIPASVRSIKDLAFYKCTNLISISIPDSVIKVSNDAFCDCPSKFKIKCHQGSWISQWAKKHFYATVPYSSKLNDFLTRNTETFETTIE